MTLLRGKQRDVVAHSRWAIALQQVGLMFITSRMIYPVCIAAGLSVADSYFIGVWAAGILAFFVFYRQAGNVEETVGRLAIGPQYRHETTGKPPPLVGLQQFFFRLLFVAVFLFSPYAYLTSAPQLREHGTVLEAGALFLVLGLHTLHGLLAQRPGAKAQ
eukprot:CAMPEP_0175854048 /NCGR_PEP_ID=MMETSP0107_2-20121207/27146_1 /TAXON_ID=195067 ORGANISM="Goniomonas pacifica, Strain CCMP1869" /NCGR_SAMPLE_ID=MMETSP0107_2 /ASSEMBLY_ACC=CAM_ASM_000203 /LENGTH=159 /DNA_ID=CAMNT_0017169839 /DNA_START=367 /DNA_END=846 /DNA_ORIENTATION=-